MKPSFAIIDWDMFFRPICCYVGPDEIPNELLPKIVNECRKSRYRKIITPDYVKKSIREIQQSFLYRQLAICQNTDKGSFIKMWAFSNGALAHELLHVIEEVCRGHKIKDEEFKCYALTWLLRDFKYKLTGRRDKFFDFQEKES